MLATVAFAATAAALLAGCSAAGSASPSPTSTLSLEDQLQELPGVVEVAAYETDVTVTIGAEASDDEVIDAGISANAIAEGIGTEATIDLVRAGGGYDAELDMPVPEPWHVAVYPGESDVVERRLAGVLWVEDLPGVTDTTVDGHWATARIDPAVDFGETFGEIAATFPFSEGATYSQGSGEHLMVVHVPERTTVEAVQTIATIAADYPTVEFLLQSPTEGPMWPQLLVANLDATQGEALDARLRQPDLADADPEGLPQQFQLTVVGPDGPTYIGGTLGDVPR